MPDIQDLTEFLAALKDEKEAIQTFIDLLQKEQQALLQGQIDDLDFLASGKARLVEKLTHLGAQRSQFLLTQGVTADRSGMSQWLEQHNEDSDLLLIWNELLTLAQTAQQINKNNGQVIAAQMQYNQRTYASLQSAAGNVSLYGPQGQAFI